MVKWSPQSYSQQGMRRGAKLVTIGHSIAVANQIVAVNSKLPIIFTLNHLAVLSESNLGFLRRIVSRSIEEPYKTFQLRKGIVLTHSGNVSRKHGRGFRTICIPMPNLMLVQKWIAENILSQISTHEASVAYEKGSKIVDAAKVHCGCSWMIKLDVRKFFESITEKQVYSVFRQQGYQPLVAFELARICTRAANKGEKKRTGKVYSAIPPYSDNRLGHLPQGAPTSPMLSNLVMIEFDKKVMEVASKYGFYYTRYADDLCLSTSDQGLSRAKAFEVIKAIYSLMNYYPTLSGYLRKIFDIYLLQ